MGARVIAFGRSKDSLAYLKERVPHPERVETVAITGDVMGDCKELQKYGPIDAFFDIGPPEAHASTHLKSAILALRHSARISLMAGYREGTLTADYANAFTYLSRRSDSSRNHHAQEHEAVWKVDV